MVLGAPNNYTLTNDCSAHNVSIRISPSVAQMKLLPVCTWNSQECLICLGMYWNDLFVLDYISIVYGCFITSRTWCGRNWDGGRSFKETSLGGLWEIGSVFSYAIYGFTSPYIVTQYNRVRAAAHPSSRYRILPGDVGGWPRCFSRRSCGSKEATVHTTAEEPQPTWSWRASVREDG